MIIGEGLVDRAFVDAWCHGFDELAEHVRPYTPAHVAAVCGLPEDDIVRAARLFGRAGAAALVSGRGVDQVGANVAPTHRAICCLRAVTGNVDKPGSCVLAEGPDFVSEMELEMSDALAPERRARCLNTPFTPLQCYDGYDRARKLTEKLGRTLPERYLTSALPHLVLRAMEEGEPYPVRALIVNATNPVSYTHLDVYKRQLQEHVAEYTPEWAAPITWLEPDQIRQAARLYAMNTPGCIQWGCTWDQIGRASTTGSHAIALMRAVCGNLDVPGGDGMPGPALNYLTDEEMELNECLPEEQKAKQIGSNLSLIHICAAFWTSWSGPGPRSWSWAWRQATSRRAAARRRRPSWTGARRCGRRLTAPRQRTPSRSRRRRSPPGRRRCRSARPAWSSGSPVRSPSWRLRSGTRRRWWCSRRSSRRAPARRATSPSTAASPTSRTTRT